MTQNAPGNQWVIIQETNPSGVTSVTHTGCDDYDWIMAEYFNIETSSAAYVYLQIGQTATPTYRNWFGIQHQSGITQNFNTAPIYPAGTITGTTIDRYASVMIANMGRNYTDGAEIQIPFYGGGVNGTTSSTISSSNGALLGSREPITTISYYASAGNLQGTGATIRTWGYRG